MNRSHFQFALALALLAAGCLLPGGLAADEPERFDPDPLLSLLELVLEADAETARKCLTVLTEKIQSREITASELDQLKPRLRPLLEGLFETSHPLAFDGALLATTWRDLRAIKTVQGVLVDSQRPSPERLRALDALLAAREPQVVGTATDFVLDVERESAEFRASVIASLGRADDPTVADKLLAGYSKLEPDVQPQVVELLTQRALWSKSLLAAIAAQELPRSALNVNQVGRLMASTDEELRTLVTATWGTVRLERNPDREKVVSEMRTLLQRVPANPHRGEQVFQKVCGQCHKIHGAGQNVGPDITSNGRASFEQLLSNVFDPSLVIGASYQARTLVTDEGRILTGLLVEDNEERVVLKMQGGKFETIPREEIDEISVSRLSLMPEGLEKQLQPQELADLLAFLRLDLPPSDPRAQTIPDIAPAAAPAGN